LNPDEDFCYQIDTVVFFHTEDFVMAQEQGVVLQAWRGSGVVACLPVVCFLTGL